MAFPPNFDRTWDETFPPDTQPANLLGQDIRNFKTDIRERVSLISGTLANRPTPEATWGGAANGMLFFATDTGQIFQWGGAAWTDITANFLIGTGGTNRAPNIVGSGSFDITATGQEFFYTVPSGGAGFYQLVLYGVCIAATGNGVTFNNCRLNWSDETGAQVSISQIGVNSIGTVGQRFITGDNTSEGGIFNVRMVVGANLELTYTVTPIGGGTADVKVYFRVLYMG